MTIAFTPIGIIRSPFTDLEGMPIQPSGARQVRGSVHLDMAYQPGLSDLDGFSHVILIYWFHAANGYDLKVTPFLDTLARGLFATRAPRRPNPIGLSVVKLLAVRGNVVEIEGVDVLDGTPLLDIKPYVPAFDAPADVSTGWLEETACRSESIRSDGRFKENA